MTDAGNLFAKVLYRRVPIVAPATTARAGGETDADISRSTATFGRSSVSVKTGASAKGALRMTLDPADEPYGVVRWFFVDMRTGENWTTYLNPNEMSSPPASRSLTRAIHTRGYARMSSIEAPVTITAWSFDGVILTKAHYDKLAEWALKPGKIRIYDHLNRIFEVIFEDFTPHEPPGRRPDDWKMKYTMSTQFLRRVK